MSLRFHHNPKLHPERELWPVVQTCLSWRWSPQQISATLRRMFPDQPDMHVSHETIYTAIYAQPAGELRRELVKCLRQAKNTRAGLAAPAATAEARSPTCSASTCARPR